MRQIALIVLLCMMTFPAAASVRIKDITTLQGVRENQIVGYGLVVGLQGTGDSLTNSIFTAQSPQSLLDQMGINIRGNGRSQTLRTRNIAAVLVTADLPDFIRPGSRIDVTVSSLGDASSLLGGTLVLTALTGIDGQTYAFAQGQVAVAGVGLWTGRERDPKCRNSRTHSWRRGDRAGGPGSIARCRAAHARLEQSRLQHLGAYR
jgi:flagellar P-ring protein FlgI